MEIYLVGGAVRDRLLGLPVKERDWVVVGATPQQMLKLGYKQVGKDFPVFLHPETGEEYALARTERKTAPGYKGFIFDTDPHVTLVEDLQRRDLTINAIAENSQGEIIDPYHGVDDLHQRILRHVSPAFVEDPVRLLRVARFYARFYSHGFQVAAETMELFKTMVNAGEINALIAERVWQEIYKAFLTNNPECFFKLLHDTEADHILFAELANLFSQAYSGNQFNNQGQATLALLQETVKLSATPEQQFASLFFAFAEIENFLPPSTIDTKNLLPPLLYFVQRYKIPREFNESAHLFVCFARCLWQAQRLTASDWLSLIERMDLLRRPQRLTMLSLLVQAVAQLLGKSFEQETIKHIGNVAILCKSVEIKDLLQNYQGEQLRAMIQQRRQDIVTEYYENIKITR